MQKTLRSLIHEKIPPELRFQLELLSRKRNLINEEKHEKIIELFREFGINDIVLLGPGTNRYAIKIDGYVLKIATDHDGKVDNLKEFKMAKRLFPYVTKTYEVSENGTLLVAEYISPFSSYHEMTTHADQIREILTKLSSTYLIGDVGITAKNFANWGLRAGSNEPVCLDFAYVYEVSSELFICRECKTGSMLVPDRDFKRLNCSNSSCGKEYSFEDIRAKIGNDIHRHEIGDLREEGYYLTSSNVVTELSEQRSNYLVSKKAKNISQSKSLENETEEDMTMSTTNFEKNAAIAKMIAENNSIVPIIRATARVANNNSEKKNLIQAIARPAKPKVVEETNPDEGLAFSGSIVDDESVFTNEDPIDHKPDIVQMPESTPIAEETIVEEKPVVIKATAKPAATKVSLETAVDDKNVKKPQAEINDWYIKHMKLAFSKISNRISNCLHIASQFDEVRHDIKDKLYAGDYYKNVQNAVFRSLVAFCNFEVTSEPNENGKGRHRIFTPPTEILGTEYEPTMIFVARVWNNRDINTVEDPDMMNVYRSTFSDYQGIQREWIEMFKDRLKLKMKITDSGLNKIANAIASEWCVPEDVTVEEVTTTDVEETVEVTVPVQEFDTIDKNGRLYTSESIGEDVTVEIPDETPSEVTIMGGTSIIDDGEEDVVFSGSTGIDVVQSPIDMDEDGYDEDESYAEAPENLSVEIYHEDDCDIIRVNTETFFGTVSIPFYAKLDEINGNDHTPSIADDRNGIWDWLIHMVPDLMFTTTDPNKWLNFNDVEPEIDQPHVVIMDEDKGVYTMGVYFLKGIFDIDDDGNMTAVFDEELLKKINKLIRDDIGYSRISHLRRSLNTDELIYNEQEIMEMLAEASINCDFNEDDDEEDIEESSVETNNEAEDAAIAAMMDVPPIAEPQVESPEEEATFEAAPEVAAEESFRFGGESADDTEGETEVQERNREDEGVGETPETDETGRVSVKETSENGAVKTFTPIRRNRN